MQINFQIDEDLIKALRHSAPISDKAIIWLLQNESYKAITFKCVSKYGGTLEDSNDVFAEAIEILIKNIILQKFQKNSKISTYFFSICRNIYLAKYHQKQKNTSPVSGFTPSIEEDIIREEERKWRTEIFDALFLRLNKKCQEVLDLQKRGFSMKDIASIMKWKKTQTAKNNAYKCRKRMRQLLKKLKVRKHEEF